MRPDGSSSGLQHARASHFPAIAARVMRQALLDEVACAHEEAGRTSRCLTVWPDVKPTDTGSDLEALDCAAAVFPRRYLAGNGRASSCVILRRPDAEGKWPRPGAAFISGTAGGRDASGCFAELGGARLPRPRRSRSTDQDIIRQGPFGSPFRLPALFPEPRHTLPHTHCPEDARGRTCAASPSLPPARPDALRLRGPQPRRRHHFTDWRACNDHSGDTTTGDQRQPGRRGRVQAVLCRRPLRPAHGGGSRDAGGMRRPAAAVGTRSSSTPIRCCRTRLLRRPPPWSRHRARRHTGDSRRVSTGRAAARQAASRSTLIVPRRGASIVESAASQCRSRSPACRSPVHRRRWPRHRCSAVGGAGGGNCCR